MKRVAILQSNYIPWKGYFDMIAMVDEFIFYDEVQFTKNDWRNRNRIKTQAGVQWITIPVYHTISDRICDVKISQPHWAVKHWKTLQTNYAKAPEFKESGSIFREIYANLTSASLSETNYTLISAITHYLGIKTKLSRSSDYQYEGDRSERLLSLCKAAGANSYLSGPAAQSYLDIGLFQSAGIEVKWMDYGGYAEYPQLFPHFEHFVSILDLIFNMGKKAKNYMRHSVVSK